MMANERVESNIPINKERLSGFEGKAEENGLNQAIANGLSHRLCTVIYTQFSLDSDYQAFDGRLAHEESFTDLLICIPQGQVVEQP
jgi:hypothetical protein